MSCAHYDDYQNPAHVGNEIDIPNENPKNVEKKDPIPNADTFNGLI